MTRADLRRRAADACMTTNYFSVFAEGCSLSFCSKLPLQYFQTLLVILNHGGRSHNDPRRRLLLPDNNDVHARTCDGYSDQFPIQRRLSTGTNEDCACWRLCISVEEITVHFVSFTDIVLEHCRWTCSRFMFPTV